MLLKRDDTHDCSPNVLQLIPLRYHPALDRLRQTFVSASAASAQGRSRRFGDIRAAFPLIADFRQKARHVRKVPLPDLCTATNGISIRSPLSLERAD